MLNPEERDYSWEKLARHAYVELGLSRELSAAHLAWLFVHVLGGLIDGAGPREEVSRSWIDEWLFGRIIGDEWFAAPAGGVPNAK